MGLKWFFCHLVMMTVVHLSWSQTLILMPSEFGGWLSSAHGVATECRCVAVGQAENSSSSKRAFWWGPRSRMIDLGDFGGGESSAFGVSSDGSVVAGFAQNHVGYLRAFRGNPNVMIDLGTFSGNASKAYNISANGSVIVGTAAQSNNTFQAFRWTHSDGMRGLGTLPGGTNESSAFGVSSDGNYIVGKAIAADGNFRAFLWSSSSPNTLLDLGIDGSESVAYGVATNGTVVGAGTNAFGQWCAFRWTPQSGAMSLGTLGGDQSVAYAVSADGEIVVGLAQTSNNDVRAFRWTPGGGMEDLNTVYSDVVPEGYTLMNAFAISQDGRIIVGNADGPRMAAFLLNTCLSGDVNRDGCVNDEDLLEVLFNYGNYGDCLSADLNCDGTVNDLDQLEVLFNFGFGCS